MKYIINNNTLFKNLLIMKTNLYFSFIGSCKGYQVETVEYFGNLLHSVDHCNGSVKIYASHHPKYVIVEEYNWQENAWYGHEYYDPNCEEKIIETYTYYMCNKNSFDCLPAVPVASFGEAVANALY